MVTSAAGVLALLDESQDELKVYALEKLNELVDVFWAEISDDVSKIEMLFENTMFKHRQLAALVASKVYFHLGEYQDSLNFALKAGQLFDINGTTEYVTTIISRAIDSYIEQRRAQYDDPSVQIDKNLVQVVQRMFQRCYDSKQYSQAIGIALESYRLDMIEESILKGDQPVLLASVLDACVTVVQHLAFRNKVLQLLVKLYHNLPKPDYISSSKCLVLLNEPKETADILVKLIKGTDDDRLMAYQIAFDVEDNATQEFSNKVKSFLPQPSPPPPKDPNAMDTDHISPSSEAVVIQGPLDKIHSILSGEAAIRLYLEFLYRNNKTDLLILTGSKNALESRNSAHHSAITFANAFQNAGTTSDEFLRQNLEWLSRATNWGKFSATASLGVIHKGHLSQSSALLAPYLPKEGLSGSVYSEGGALFALGLIHANHGTSVIPLLTKHLKATQSEVIQHGAALGLGVAGMACGDEEVYEQLKSVLYNDSAVAGEAAGIAMGLVMLGTGSPKALDEMLQYARETQHEKIIRGLSIGMAMIMFGREENADVFIEELCSDKDAILRYGGIYTVAMAYCGTGSNKAVKRLLHVAVSDVNDDVRRAAVTGLGFILFKQPNQVPRVVQLLSESYNPHVRHGATLALGIACAGTGSEEALNILKPLTKDSVDYVRQGALIALAMILIQHNESQSPYVKETRELYQKTIADKRAELLAHVGAVLGQGIIDAGGRNVTISLRSKSGYDNIPAIVGMAMFTQFWYWFPLAHFLPLAFTPTGVLGLNKDLEVPKFTFTSNCKPSQFAYPPPTKPPTKEVVEKVKTAVLSTTAKSKSRQKKKQEEEEEMQVDAKPEEKEEKEPETQTLENFVRVVPKQTKYIVFDPKGRYQPLSQTVGGIVMLKDTKPLEPEELITLSMSLSAKPKSEPKPPQAFEHSQ
ncbi:armadillo-type protein [Gorgonomyces haynaldii]|nr:armadillo-type protein [Gorgonomyces haynaldii]